MRGYLGQRFSGRAGIRVHVGERCNRRAAAENAQQPVLPRRRRLGRRAGSQRQTGISRPRPRSPGHLQDPRRPGTDVPAERRPQPAALRPVVCSHGRVRQTDSARAVHVGFHRPRAAAHAVRWRSVAVQGDEQPLLETGDSGGRADRVDVGWTATRRCSARPIRTATWSSTRACSSSADGAARPSGLSRAPGP